jgi:nitrogen fixation protein NifQ
MDANALYGQLMAGRRCDDPASFDAHVVASILAIAAAETRPGQTISDGVGLDGAQLRSLVVALFPGVGVMPGLQVLDRAVERPEDEECLRDLLTRFSTTGSGIEQQLAAMIARRAMRPNHLWQDLGLRNRGELSRLMARHFTALARRNDRDMKWKKFLYRMICRDEGYTICTAPSCAECDDFQVCFGDESGESLLAAVRRAANG